MDKYIDKTLVSIIIPVYNTPREMITKCLESLVSQKGDYEFIFVNDGSSVDYIEPLINRYLMQDKRVYYIGKTNTGVSNTRNVGMSQAKGKYVMFVDSDDYLYPNAIEYSYRTIEEMGADVLLLGHNSSSNVKVKKILSADEIKKLKIGVLKFSDSTFCKMGVNIDAPWAKIFKRDIINHNTIRFPEDIHRSEDAIFDLSVYEYSKIIAIDNTPIYSYESNPNSICCTFGQKEVDMLPRILQYEHDFVQQFHEGNYDYIKALAYRTFKGVVDADLRFFLKNAKWGQMSKKVMGLSYLLSLEIIAKYIKLLPYKEVNRLNKLRLFYYKNNFLYANFLMFKTLHFVKEIYGKATS